MHSHTLAPTTPVVIEIDLATLQDKAFRDVFCDDKLRWAIAKQIVELRVQRRWSQAELAQRIGSHQAVISSIENPKGRWPSLATLKNIARAFDVALICRFVTTRAFLEHIASLEASSLWIPPYGPYHEST